MIGEMHGERKPTLPSPPYASALKKRRRGCSKKVRTDEIQEMLLAIGGTSARMPRNSLKRGKSQGGKKDNRRLLVQLSGKEGGAVKSGKTLIQQGNQEIESSEITMMSVVIGEEQFH